MSERIDSLDTAKEAAREIAASLKGYFKDDPLFVPSQFCSQAAAIIRKHCECAERKVHLKTK